MKLIEILGRFEGSVVAKDERLCPMVSGTMVLKYKVLSYLLFI